MAINFPSSPTNGQVYTDTTSAMTWVYSTTDTAWSGSFNRSNYVSQTFTATAGQTSFTVTGGYLPTLIEVYQNGVLLVNGTDVTVTSGTAVVLAVGAVVGDIIQVIGNSTFNAAAIDASAITAGTLAVARGGTGASTLTANNVVLGNGTSAVQTVAPGTNGNVLTSNGTTWTSATPAASPVINSQTFTSTPSAPGWTKPAGYSANSRVLIQAWGGGGSGGKGSAVGATAAGGGGYNERWMTLSDMGATETITIGAGGTAVTAIGPGNAGGTTTVGSLVSAYGGGAGISGNGGGGGGGQLSAGTRGDVKPAEFASGVGNTGFPGAPWPTLVDTNASASAPGMGGQQTTAILTATTNGFPAFMHGGGGGGASGTTGGAGGASVWGGGGGGGAGSSTAGAGGASSFGGAGGAGSVAGNGTAGTQPGGGGGATRSGTSTGAGGAGQVIITVFPA